MPSLPLVIPVPGKTYLVKHSSGVIRATFLRLETFCTNRPYPQKARTYKHYFFENCRTKREICFKSPRSVLSELKPERCFNCYNCLKVMAERGTTQRALSSWTLAERSAGIDRFKAFAASHPCTNPKETK